jgi:hypothetical protein
MPEPGMTSFRMPPDLLAALRKRAEDSGESLRAGMEAGKHGRDRDTRREQ